MPAMPDPPYRHPAVPSPTFTPPPVDGSLSIPQLFDFHAAHSPHHPLFAYSPSPAHSPSPSSSSSSSSSIEAAADLSDGLGGSEGARVELSWSRVARAVRRHAVQVLRDTGHEHTRPVDPERAHTVAILAHADSVAFTVLLVGIMRAGLRPFPISPRNSPAAVRHLLAVSRASHLYASFRPDGDDGDGGGGGGGGEQDFDQNHGGDDEAIHALVRAALEPHPGEAEGGAHNVVVLRVQTFDELFDDNAHDSTDADVLAPLPPQDMTAPAVLLHSSGTTAFPKPIALTHAMMLQWGRIALYSKTDVCGQVISVHSVPMFHAMGIACISRAPITGLILAVLPPHTPPLAPTPARVLSAIQADACALMTCVPSFLESWSTDPRAMPALAALRALFVTGGPLSQDAGDRLAAAGVPLFSYYAGTEVGPVTVFLPDKRGPSADWQYFAFSPHFEAHFVPQEDDPGVVELVTVAGPSYTPAVTNTTVAGRPAFATQDLFVRHPTDPGRWRVLGRADEQIMLSSGEKTNPGPIEDVFCRDPRVERAIMFGRGRFHNGILLQLRTGADAGVHPGTQDDALRAFRTSIQPLLDQANAAAPSHSRLFPEMVLVAHPDRPLSTTAKGTVRRRASLATYADAIDATYEAFARAPPSSAALQALAERGAPVDAGAVAAVVREVLGRAPDRDKDLFQQGCDSLQATRIRSVLVSLARASDAGLDAARVPDDVVYRCPTVARLAAFFAGLRDAGEDADADSSAGGDAGGSVREMEDLVARFAPTPMSSAAVPAAVLVNGTAGDVVLVTGTTGSLGSHLLHALAGLPTVSRIYAFNRAHRHHRHHHHHNRHHKSGAPQSLLHRQEAALAAHGLDASVLAGPKIVLLEGDLSVDGWGLAEELMDEMRRSVSVVVHTAWTVDFKCRLASFTDCLAGLRRLVEFCLPGSGGATRPRKLIFTSTLSVLHNQRSSEAPTIMAEAPLPDPASARGTGYAESKWVAERVLHGAADAHGLDATVVRVGQLSGADNGCWKVAEWFPTLVKASQMIRCFPEIDRAVSWLPVSVAAAVICDVLHCRARYLHLCHPRATPFSALAVPIAASLDVPLVPFGAWAQRLHAFRAAQMESESESAAETGLAGGELRALALVDFLARTDAASGEHALMRETGDVALDAMRACSATLAAPGLRRLGEADALGWLAYWRGVGWV